MVGRAKTCARWGVVVDHGVHPEWSIPVVRLGPFTLSRRKQRHVMGARSTTDQRAGQEVHLIATGACSIDQVRSAMVIGLSSTVAV